MPTEFPDSLLSEAWAQTNHSQTLKRLNERGGLCIGEIACNILNKPLYPFPIENQELVDKLNALIEQEKLKHSGKEQSD